MHVCGIIARANTKIEENAPATRWTFIFASALTKELRNQQRGETMILVVS